MDPSVLPSIFRVVAENAMKPGVGRKEKDPEEIYRTVAERLSGF
ncbi:MAG: hypothetical protein ACOX2P_01090 [Bacillota bacterium]